jgi:hypothetical protein
LRIEDRTGCRSSSILDPPSSIIEFHKHLEVGLVLLGGVDQPLQSEDRGVVNRLTFRLAKWACWLPIFA